MKIYLATWTEENQGVSLTKAGARHRLVSYFFLKELKDPAMIKNYVKTGVWKNEDSNKRT